MTKEISAEENVINMQRCPRWGSCSNPKCLLDSEMRERIELGEDRRCILQKLLGKNRSNRMGGNISLKMRHLCSFIPEKNRI